MVYWVNKSALVRSSIITYAILFSDGSAENDVLQSRFMVASTQVGCEADSAPSVVVC
jgi:hypothetical protein